MPTLTLTRMPTLILTRMPTLILNFANVKKKNTQRKVKGTSLTTTTISGSPAYMAPEQLEGTYIHTCMHAYKELCMHLCITDHTHIQSVCCFHLGMNQTVYVCVWVCVCVCVFVEEHLEGACWFHLFVSMCMEASERVCLCVRVGMRACVEEQWERACCFDWYVSVYLFNEITCAELR